MKRVLVMGFLLAGAVLLVVTRTDVLRGRRDDVGMGHNPIAPTPEALDAGSRIYQQHCAACHGTDGAGNGPAAADLNPRPVDLRMHTAMGHTDSQLFRRISDGVPGTAMPAFRSKLTEEERWYVITFIRTTFTPTDR